MKTSLKVLAFVLAVSVPSVFVAQLIGFALPPLVDSLHLFAAFAMTVVLMIAFADYTREQRRPALTPAVRKAEHPLAA